MARTLEDKLVAAAKHADRATRLARLVGDHEARAILRVLASLQDGQFATAQARTLGLTPTAIRWLSMSGETQSVTWGVWRFRSAPGDPDPAVTAWLLCWPHGVIARRSAAARHTLIKQPPTAPELWVPRGVTRAPSGVQVRVTRCLEPRDIAVFGAVAYTTLARTACDVADPSDPWATLTHVDNAVALGARVSWLHSCAVRLRNGRPGVVLVARATAPGAADEFRSWLERTSSHVYRAGGLPLPEWNVPVYDADRRRIGIVDALWRPWGVIAEKEGLRFHTTPGERRRDAKRFNRLLDAEYDPRRFTWYEVVTEPVYVVQTIAKALAAAGADVDPGRVPADISVSTVPFMP